MRFQLLRFQLRLKNAAAIAASIAAVSIAAASIAAVSISAVSEATPSGRNEGTKNKNDFIFMTRRDSDLGLDVVLVFLRLQSAHQFPNEPWSEHVEDHASGELSQA